MIIHVASKNPQKVQAVSEALAEYPSFQITNISSFETNTGVSEQPKTLDETITGAINRSKNVFSNCDYSFGIESGLMSVPYTKTGRMDLCACAIYDGSNHCLGLSSAFELPIKANNLIESDGLDINEAFHRLGLNLF